MNDILGESYHIYQLFVSPEDVGHSGINRRRTYLFCSHRETGRYVYDIYEAYAAVCAAIRTKPGTSPADYLVATPTQVAAEAMQVAHTRKKTYKHASWLRLPHACFFEIIHQRQPATGSQSEIQMLCPRVLHYLAG